MSEPRNTPTKIEPSRTHPGNLPPTTSPGVTRRVAELTGMVEPSGFSDPIPEPTQEEAIERGAAAMDPEGAIEEEVTREPGTGPSRPGDKPHEQKAAIEEEQEREALGPNDRGEPRRLTPLEEAALTAPTHEADGWTDAGTTDTPDIENDEDTGDIGTDDGFARAWREAMSFGPAHVFEVPSTIVSPEEYDRRRKALEDARAILGPAIAGSLGSGSHGRPVMDIVYAASWILDAATPVHIPYPRFVGEERSDG